MSKLNIKRGDSVKIIAGDDKGKVATVIKVFPKNGKILVEGCKLATKAIKPTEENKKGGFSKIEMPINISNVKKVED